MAREKSSISSAKATKSLEYASDTGQSPRWYRTSCAVSRSISASRASISIRFVVIVEHRHRVVMSKKSAVVDGSDRGALGLAVNQEALDSSGSARRDG